MKKNRIPGLYKALLPGYNNNREDIKKYLRGENAYCVVSLEDFITLWKWIGY
jgi:hypothetical protein